MKKNRLKLISSFVVIITVVIVFGVFYRSVFLQEEGSITVTIIDETGSIKSSKEIDISSYHNMLELLEDNYEIKGEYFYGGFFLESIDGIAPPPNYYFYLILNDEITNVGISRLEYHDKDNITLKIMNLEGYNEYINK